MMLPHSPTLDPAVLIRDHAGFGEALTDPVDVLLYGLLLDCPGCRQATTALIAFFPTGDPTWQQHRIMLCNTETSLAVADAALTELAHIENTVGRPAYNTDDPAELVNGCFHCDWLITGNDLAEEIRRTYLDGLVELGPARVPAAWLTAALNGAGSFLNRGDVPGVATVPNISHALRELAIER